MIVEDLSNLIANLRRAIKLGTVDLISKRVDASIGIPQIIIGIYAVSYTHLTLPTILLV